MLGQRCHFASPAGVLRGVTVAENYLFRCWTQRRFSSFWALFNPYPHYLDATIKLHLFSPRFPRITRHRKGLSSKEMTIFQTDLKLLQLRVCPSVAQIMFCSLCNLYSRSTFNFCLPFFLEYLQIKGKCTTIFKMGVFFLIFVSSVAAIMIIVLATRKPGGQPMAALFGDVLRHWPQITADEHKMWPNRSWMCPVEIASQFLPHEPIEACADLWTLTANQSDRSGQLTGWTTLYYWLAKLDRTAPNGTITEKWILINNFALQESL